MSIYNLFNEDKEMLEKALSVLAQTYDQHGFKTPKSIFRLKDKISKCSTIQLHTNTSQRTFPDEA